MTSPSATQDSYPYQNEPIWSRSEKVIARTAFDAALGRELHEVIQEAKRMASQIQQSSDLWDLVNDFLCSARHFLSPKISLISEISSFSTATPCLQQFSALIPKLS